MAGEAELTAGRQRSATRARMTRRSGGGERSKEHEGNERHRERCESLDARDCRWKRRRGDGWRWQQFRVSLRVRSERRPLRWAGVAVAVARSTESCGAAADCTRRFGCGRLGEVSRSESRLPRPALGREQPPWGAVWCVSHTTTRRTAGQETPPTFGRSWFGRKCQGTATAAADYTN